MSVRNFRIRRCNLMMTAGESDFLHYRGLHQRIYFASAQKTVPITQLLVIFPRFSLDICTYVIILFKTHISIVIRDALHSSRITWNTVCIILSLVTRQRFPIYYKTANRSVAPCKTAITVDSADTVCLIIADQLLCSSHRQHDRFHHDTYHSHYNLSP